MPRDERAPVVHGEDRRARIRRGATLYAVGLIAITGGVALVSGAWRDDAAVTPTTVVETTVAATTLPATTVAPTTTQPIVTPCPKPDGSSPRTVRFAAAPPNCLDTAATYTAVLKTSKGQMLIRLDQQATPVAVNNFVYLARYHFFDGLEFHRVVGGYLMQAGDPEGTGEGGPGYTITGEAGTGSFSVGSVAMTGTGAGVNGSQFFIVSGSTGVDSLKPTDFTPLGRVINGLPVVKAIDKLAVDPGDTQGKPPSEKVTIDRIEIRSTGEQSDAGTTTVVGTTVAG